MKTNLTALNKKYLITIPLILLLAAFAFTFGAHLGESQMQEDPNAVAAAAIDNFLNASSYHFESSSSVDIENETLEYGKIQGEFSGDAYHIWGNILGGEVENYQIGNTSYRKDTLTQKWSKSQNESPEDNIMLINELDPRINFNFSELGQANYTDNVKIDDENFYQLVLEPTLADQWIVENFQNITYTLLINAKTKELTYATIAAETTSGQSTARLTIDLHVFDYGADINITAPMLEE